MLFFFIFFFFFSSRRRHTRFSRDWSSDVCSSDLIDAAEFIGPYDDEKLGFYKVAPYYYYPGWWEGSAQGSLFVNINHWNLLPASYQSAIEVASAEANGWMVAKYDTVNVLALRRLLDRGTKLRPFSKEIMDACFSAAFALYDEIAATNPN